MFAGWNDWNMEKKRKAGSQVTPVALLLLLSGSTTIEETDTVSFEANG